MMEVPFLDLATSIDPIREELDDAIRYVIDGRQFASGPYVERFETAFASYVGRQYCVAVNSGTTALHFALLALGVGPGDEVITTPHTWISTSWAISYCGARPVYVDIDPGTGNLDPQAVAAAITHRTAAILPVDLYGNPADHRLFQQLADKYGLPLVDDAAQAHGARLEGLLIGAYGKVAAFSFYPGKNLGAFGEGGAVVTDDSEIASRVRRLRDHAQSIRHHHVEVGFNGRMDGIQGAILSVKLRHLDAWNDSRRIAAARYNELLSDLDDVELPSVTEGAQPSWHLYVIRLPDRDAVASRLATWGIGTGIHYPTPVPFQPAYSDLGYRPGMLPNAETFMSRCLSLPMFPGITTRQQEQVKEALTRAIKESR